MLRKMVADGIEWSYRPNVRHVGKYRGFDISITRIGARSKETGLPWRLYVNKDNGGSLAFSHQFWPTTAAARKEAIRLVNSHPAAVAHD